jgi:hypothetical protein
MTLLMDQTDVSSWMIFGCVGYCRISRSADMDAVTRVRDFLLDNIGHMTYPGAASFDAQSRRWLVPICCRTERGNVTVGEVELDAEGHIIFAPSKEELIARLALKSDARSSTDAGAAEGRVPSGL